MMVLFTFHLNLSFISQLSSSLAYRFLLIGLLSGNGYVPGDMCILDAIKASPGTSSSFDLENANNCQNVITLDLDEYYLT